VLKEIYREYEDGKILVGPTDIAKKIGVAKSTAHSMLKEIAKRGYGTYIERKGLILNSDGLKLAREIIRKHRLIECFLFYHLSIPPEKACKEAGKIDGVVGDDFMREIEKRFGRYKKCPCGKDIPSY